LRKLHVNNNYTTLPPLLRMHQADFTGTTIRACRRRLSYRLHSMPLDNELDHIDLQPCDHGLSLTGAHLTVACASCHVNNNYTTLRLHATAAIKQTSTEH